MANNSEDTLLIQGKESNKDGKKIRNRTPTFGEAAWWTFIVGCLSSITLLSAWQNAVKAAMSIHLGSADAEVIHFSLKQVLIFGRLNIAVTI